jgi:outer membrane protein OmpA-like peptidoglycan-associated protein
MKIFRLIPLLVVLLLANRAKAQENKLLHEADLATSTMDYEEAIATYDKVLALDSNSYRANAGKGMLLSLYLDRYKRAIPYLERALNETPKDTLIGLFDMLGKCNLYVNNYSRSIYYFNRVKANDPKYDPKINIQIANCNYAMSHPSVAKESEAWIKNIGLPINSNMPDYGAVPIGNDLIFTSERKDSKDEKRNGVSFKYFETMYKSTLIEGKYSEPVRFSFPDNMNEARYIKHNEAVISMSADGKLLYIFRDGRIYETDLSDTSQIVNKLDRNVNIAHYQNHASITPDGRELYFVSNDKKGYGGTDIYVTRKDTENNWSTPEILDMTVNTVYDEDAPFMNADGILYFSSNGLQGYGGFDVYKTHKENGVWTVPENLGRPINGSGDDLYFSLQANSTEGFYSSARLGGIGDMDIYQVHYAPVKPTEFLESLAIAAPIEKIEIKPIVQQPKKTIWNPSSIYFDFDKYSLREDALKSLDYNISELKKNAEYTFTISGYADSRGTQSYNKTLTDQRANTVKTYMIKNGIEKNRITATYSFGKTMLSNNCTDGVECTDEEQQKNRRVDFKIIDREKISKPYLGFTENK